ncbi:MAG: ATP-binding protein [Lachnospiraceae bacterium]
MSDSQADHSTDCRECSASRTGTPFRERDGRISAFLTEQRLIIRISDDGAGMSRTQAEALREKLSAGMDGLITSGTRHGIALVNVNERLKLYFGEEYGLSFSSAEQCGTIVELILPRKVEKTFKNSTEKVMES